MGLKITNKIKQFIIQNERALDIGLDNMSKDIEVLGKMRVPYKEGDLMDEIKAKRVGRLRYKVVVDKEYAAYQERGKRKDGSRVVRKYTTPSTGKNFLSKSGDQVGGKASDYFKQAVNNIRLGLN